MTDVWTIDASDGELLIRTGVAGRAARMGHRLTIAMNRWQATVNWTGAEPVAAELTVEIDSFEVLGGEGGVKGLS
ncbi:MAG TPA: YceI family protein, partial [Mycobacterium sp.]|nr:YceI family protein [Mycobacterium sp.]